MPKITRKRIYSQQEIEPRRSGFSGCNGRSTIDRSISIHLRVPRPNSKFQDNGPIFAAWSKSNIRAAVSGSQLLSRLILSNEAARRDHSLALRVAPGGPSPRGAFFFFLARFNYLATSFVLASRVPRTFSQRRSIKRETTSRQHSLERNQQRRLFVRSASTKREDEIWLRRVVHSFRVVSPFKTLFLGTYGDCRLSFFSTDSENRRLAHSRFSRLKSARLFALAKVRSSAVSPRVANAFKDGLRGSTSRLHCTRIERTCRDDQTRSLKDIFKPCREDDRVSSPSTISFSPLRSYICRFAWLFYLKYLSGTLKELLFADLSYVSFPVRNI